MKKYTLTALVLGLIAGVCATLIVLLNMLTAPIIEQNTLDKKARLCQEIFVEYDMDSSKTINEGFESNYIKEKIEAYDDGGNFLGYIYTVSGQNAYGAIELLVGINDEYRLEGVRFITNGQSFSSEADSHLNNQYKDNMTIEDILAIDLTKSDVTAGATYASKLIRELVTAAFNDAKGGN